MNNLKSITLKEAPIRPRPVLTYRDIIGLLTDMFENFSEDIFKSKSRKREYAYVRFIAMWYMARHLKLGLKYIGTHFADKDHSSVIHARTKVNEAAEKAGRNPTLHLWHSKFSEYAIPPHIDQLLRKRELAYCRTKEPMKDNWIPVSERLPEHENNVLAVVDGRRRVMRYVTIHKGGQRYRVWAYVYGGLEGDGWHDDDYLVTHWMEIPDLPDSIKNNNP